MPLLKLMPGGVLLLEDDSPAHKADVTAEALFYLFEPIALDPRVRLKDVFALLDKEPALALLNKRDFGPEYLAEYRRLLTEQAIVPQPPDDGTGQALAWLELSQAWLLRQGSPALQGLWHLDFSGLSFPIKSMDTSPYEGTGLRIGDQVPCALEFAPLAELLDIPLRINPVIDIHRVDPAHDRCETLLQVRVDHLPLGLLIRSVLWELSFCGTPEEARQQKELLQSLTAELGAKLLTAEPTGQAVRSS